MRILRDFAVEGQRAPALAVLLPGALQQPEEFMRAGFVEAVRKRRLPLDLALTDPGLQFVGEAIDGAVLQRLHESLVQPARVYYEEIWIAGISLGGFMALTYADRYPGSVDGLCLIAPYPGNRIVTNEIAAAGGLAAWRPEAFDGDAERRMWRWLKARNHDRTGPHVHLAYGLQDRFAAGQRMMAETFAPGDIDMVDGGHDWPAWFKLWENFLERRTFPARRRTSSQPS